MICQLCNDLVKNALKLRQQSLHSEKMLLEQLNTCIKQENLLRAESTDSENEISNFRQLSRKKPQTKNIVGESSKTTTKSNKCESKNAKDVSKNECGKEQFNKINIKIENHSESDQDDASADNNKKNEEEEEDLLQEISFQSSKQRTPYSNEELKEVYRILDQETEQYKTKCHNLKKDLAKDEVYHSLSPELKYLYNKLLANTSTRKTKSNKCENKNAKVVSINESRPQTNENTRHRIKGEEQSLKIDVKIENCSESNEQDNMVRAVNTRQEKSHEISRKHDTRGIPTSNEELEEIYKIIDQDLEQSKATYKSDNNVKKAEKDENIVDSLIAYVNSDKMRVKSKILPKGKKQMKTKTFRKQVHDEAKMAKLWSIAVKPTDRKKPVQCSVCHKYFKYNYFPAHAAIHLDKEFTCEVCTGNICLVSSS